MISFEAARERVLSDVAKLAVERVALREALGRVLAQDVVARAPFPPFDASAMDGYAVLASSLARVGPFTLDVSGEARMGTPPGELVARTACRILA